MPPTSGSSSVFSRPERTRCWGTPTRRVAELEDLLGGGGCGPHWFAASLLLTRCYLESGDPSACIETGEPLLEVLPATAWAAATRPPRSQAGLQHSWARGDHERAIELCRAIADSTPDTIASELNAYVAASATKRAASDLNLASRVRLSIARARAEHARAQAASARFHAQFAEFLLAGPEPDIGAARERLALASTLAAQDGSDPREAASIRLSFAKVLVLKNKFDEALHALPTEGELAGSVMLTATRLVLAGQIQRGTGNPEAARSTLAEAARVLGQAEGDRAAAQMWYESRRPVQPARRSRSPRPTPTGRPAEATGLAVVQPEVRSSGSRRRS